jgi:hypothetical protein
MHQDGNPAWNKPVRFHFYVIERERSAVATHASRGQYLPPRNPGSSAIVF